VKGEERRGVKLDFRNKRKDFENYCGNNEIIDKN
jgi:hypothetical protein